MSFYRKYFPVILFCAFCGLLPLQGMEISGFLRPEVKSTVLPVFPSDPLVSGMKTVPVFDVMLDKEGRPLFMVALYSPNESFSEAYKAVLPLRTYQVATERETPMFSMFRDIVDSYFYIDKVSPDGEITKLPVFQLSFDRNICQIAQNVDHEVIIRLKIDKKGRLVKAKAKSKKDRLFTKSLFKLRKGKKIFSPAYVGDEPVAFSVVMVFNDIKKLPLSIVKDVLRKKEVLRSPKVTETKHVLFKLSYGTDFCMRSIVANDTVSDFTPDEMWTLMSGLRFRNREGGSTYDEDLITLQLQEGKDPVETEVIPLPYEMPKVISRSMPIIPMSFRKSHFKGVIKIRITIDKEGNVVNPELFYTDAKDLDSSYVDFIKTWKYKPAMYNGVPVETKFIQPFKFDFSDK